MYKPELLGEFKDYPELEGRDEDSVKRFMALVDQRQKAAEAIPAEMFDIDLCILEMNEGEFSSRLIFEKDYGYIGGSASGKSNKEMKNIVGYFVMSTNITVSRRRILTVRQSDMKSCLEHWQ